MAQSNFSESDIPTTALDCRFKQGRATAAVFVDTDSGVLYFRNCFVPRKFLASR